ncbi:MAG: NADH-quinone oxidoreductase subunit NuoN [Helicobacteraceae bacterium]|nr:NADH-quinone oxidoreductase subunit NuoN [Helicobacteraceae bacterium]
MIEDILLALPLAIVVLGAIVLMLISHFPTVSLKKYNLIAVFFLVCAFILKLTQLDDSNHIYLFEPLFNKMFVIDTFSNLFDLLFLAGAIVTLLINTHYFQERDYYNGEFFSLLLFSVFGMMMLSHANELVTAFISLEIASISVYILVGYNKNSLKSSEAMLTYIVLGALSSTFFILGTALIYGVVGSTFIGDIYSFIQNNPTKEITMLIVALMFIMVTILFKIGAVPFHSWVIDVYQGAPYPITMFMAATFKIAVFAIFLRLYLIDFTHFYDIFSKILQVVAVVTLIGGSWLAISQNNLKRMLAGSSIVHAGYLLIALSSIGLGAEFAAPAIVFYLMSYFLSAVGAFGILSFIAAQRRRRATFDDFKGFSQERPYLAAMMTIFMLSLAGFPSTIGFLAKFYIFLSAIESGQIFLAGLGITVAFISIYYYFKLIALMYFYPTDEEPKKFPFGISSSVIFLMALLTIWGGVGTGWIPFLPGVDTLVETAKEAINSISVKPY